MDGPEEDPSSFERGVSISASDEAPTEPPAESLLASLSRRKLLGSIAAIGASGAVSGAGVHSLLYDEEVFGNGPGSGGDAIGNAVGNAFNVNVLQGGELDLKLCWQEPGEVCTPVEEPAPIEFGEVRMGDTGSATLRCGLEDNPGWLWFRTSCPVNPCGLENALEVTFWYDSNCDGEFDEETERPLTVTEGGEEIPIENMELCKALSHLRQGIMLDGTDDGQDDPLRPDDTCCIGFQWEVVDVICVEDDELDIEFEFYTEQWRHNMNPLKPPDWQGVECDVDCETECAPCEFQDISFVAFCIEDDGESIGPGDVSFVPHFDPDGGAFRIDWESDVGIDWVVLYYATTFENFQYDGTVTSDEIWVHHDVNGPSTNEFTNHFYVDFGDNDQHPSDPCAITSEDGCGVKYEFEDTDDDDDVIQDNGVWEAVCNDKGP